MAIKRNWATLKDDEVRFLRDATEAICKIPRRSPRIEATLKELKHELKLRKPVLLRSKHHLKLR
jgi:hypothetical protein